MKKVIYVVGCRKSEADEIAKETGISDEYFLEVIPQTTSGFSQSDVLKIISGDTVDGVISSTFTRDNPHGAAIIRHCCITLEGKVPYIELVNGGVNWPDGFKRLIEILPPFEKKSDNPRVLSQPPGDR